MADEPVASIEAAPKTVGSTWVHSYKEKRFPVVICNEDTVPKPFFELRSNDNHIPAILLGKHIYVWVSDETLEEYDPNYNYAAECEAFDQPDVQKDDSQGTRYEKLRRMAFTVEAPELRDNKYWHHYILSESKVRSLEWKMNSQQSEASDEIEFIGANRRSNSSSKSPEYSSGRSKRTKKSGRTGSQQLLTPKSTPNSKQVNFTGIIEISDQEEPEEDESLFVEDSGESQDPFTDGPTNGRRKRARGRPSSVKRTPPTMTDKECRMFLGSNGQSVIARRARCEESEYLTTLEHYDEKRGEHVIDLNEDKRAVQLDLTHAELIAIWEYLWSGDLGPEYLRAPDDYQPFGRLSDARKEKYAQQLASAFVTASKTQLIPLQDLIEKKLNALYPLPPLALLIVALILTRMPPMGDQTDPQEKVVNWLIGALASQFWNLAKNHTGAIQRLLRANDDLREAVYHKMQINADEGMEGCEEL